MPRRCRAYRTKNLRTEEAFSSNEIFRTFAEEELFTYDKISIRKILVANIDPRTTHKKLKETFAIYGEIVDCNLKKKSLKKSYAFITYKDATSARSALSSGYETIYLDSQYLRVLPAAAWHQPDRNKNTNNKLIIEENRLSAYDHYTSNEECHINKLNEYCLLHIFGYLPIKDRIRIERVCRYWKIITLESPFKNFDLLSDDNWMYIKNAPTLYKILEKFGNNITKVNYLNKPELGNSTLIAIAKLCPNVEEIDLKDFPFLTSGLKALAKNCTKIKYFGIKMPERAKFSEKYDKELSALFSKNPYLKGLDLRDRIIDGSCLKHLSTKYIVYMSITNLDCAVFARVISKIQNLFTLRISECDNLDKLLGNSELKLNAENIENLEITNFSLLVRSKYYKENFETTCTEMNNFFKFNNLKNLKYLNLSSCNFVTDSLLHTLGDNFKHQLTYLDISYNSNEYRSGAVTNSGIIWIISSLSNLEHFLMAGFKEVTDEIFCCGMPNLKTLNCSYCPKIKDEGLIKFIYNSDKLEKLDVSYCELITNKLISAAEYKVSLSIDAVRTKVFSKVKPKVPFCR